MEGYVRPVAYCERDRYAAACLLSRMRSGDLPRAPIWDDVRTLRASDLKLLPDIIYGGFPCQDISVAGRRAGLESERSGLFFQIVRLTSEIRPRFIFLENVSAITIRGAERVVGELCRLRYDCRWGVLSAADVGANHRRERWWLLAHANDGARCTEQGQQQEAGAEVAGRGGAVRQPTMADTSCERLNEAGPREPYPSGQDVADAVRSEQRWEQWETKAQGDVVADAPGTISTRLPSRKKSEHTKPRIASEMAKSKRDGLEKPRDSRISGGAPGAATDASWWAVEPNVGRVAHGVPFRVDRLRALGNAVVPAQAREAFERLMGLK